MATGIDVFFTGLMLICLDGQTNCPVGEYYPNTAWVVKADGPRKICGWDSKEETKLELRFSPFHFSYDRALAKKYCIETGPDIQCSFTEKDLCVYPYPNNSSRQLEGRYSHLEWLPRLDQIDRRFKELHVDRLNDPYYVPTRIHFPIGNMIGPGPKWPEFTDGTDKPITWYRSDGSAGGSLPRHFSDRLKVTYEESREIWVTDCKKPASFIFKLTVKDGIQADAKPHAVFQNYSKKDPVPDYIGDYDDLAYLLWYYRLGSWATAFETCPDYTSAKRDAVLLRCVRQVFHKSCSYESGARRDTTFWPPMLVTH